MLQLTMTPGRIIYKLFYQPVDAIGKLYKTGFLRSLKQERNRKEMHAAAFELKEIVHPGKETHDVYFLTGRKYWYQTAFCLYSLQRHVPFNIRAHFADDGTFDNDLEQQVHEQFPSSEMIRAAEIQQLLDAHLPEKEFPVIRRRRLEYPHLRKLTDIHLLPGSRPKLVLDSDMLFFRKPSALIKWLQQPEGFIFLRDSEESYGYSRQLMKELAQCESIPARLNVGIAGIPSDNINWKQLETWIMQLMEREGSSYLQEQALTAMMAAHAPYTFLDEKDYKVLPTIENGQIAEVLHHYVAGSKYDYFVSGWRKAIEPIKNHIIENRINR
jgi:hypothetical protein